MARPERRGAMRCLRCGTVGRESRRCGECGCDCVRVLRPDELRTWRATADLDPEERCRAVTVRCGLSD